MIGQFRKEELIMNYKALMLIIVSVIAITGCNDYGRYEAARNHITGETCYVLDWKTKERLPATDANVKLADGDFWADPEQCQR